MNRKNCRLMALILLASLPLGVCAEAPIPPKGTIESAFQVVELKPTIKELAGGIIRMVSYGQISGSNKRTIAVHVRTSETRNSLPTWATEVASHDTKFPVPLYGVLSFVGAKDMVNGRIVYSNIHLVRAPETHQLADGSGQEYEIVLTADMQKNLPGRPKKNDLESIKW